MKRQELSLQDLQKWLEDTKNLEIVYATELPLKKLTVLGETFKVYHNGIAVYKTMYPTNAIEFYNNL